MYSELVKTSKTLMLKEPFYGLFLISLNKEVSDKVPTAGVCKDNINFKLLVNPEFWGKIDSKSRLGVLKHELLHIAMFHLNMQDKYEDKKLFNIAADLEINQYIQEEFMGEGWDGLSIQDEPFKSLNLEPRKGTKYYYDKLKEEKQNNPDGEASKFMDGMGDGQSDGLGHDFWEEFDKLGEAEKKLISKQIDYTFKEIAKELESKNRGRGLVPAEMRDYIDSLFEEKPPVVDWKAYVRRFSGMSTKIQTKKTRYKLNKRFPDNPALKIKPRKTTLVAIDTSGSVSDKDLEEFFNEIHHIYKTGVEITIVECDTEIKRDYVYKGKRNKIEVWGRGGTDFNMPFEYARKNKNKFNNIIYLTDGEAPPPDVKVLVPVLWVHCSSCKINEDLPGSKIQIQR